MNFFQLRKNTIIVYYIEPSSHGQDEIQFSPVIIASMRIKTKITTDIGVGIDNDLEFVRSMGPRDPYPYSDSHLMKFNPKITLARERGFERGNINDWANPSLADYLQEIIASKR